MPAGTRLITAAGIAIALIVGTPALPTTGGHPATAAAAGTADFMLDTLSSGSDEVVRAFHQPGDSTVTVWWSNNHLTVHAEATGGGYVDYTLATGDGTAPVVGTYPTALVNTLTGTLTIAAIEPALALNTSVQVTKLTASFARNSGSESTIGEVRVNSTDTYAALGDPSNPAANWPLSMLGAGQVFVGRSSGLATATLKNLGTTGLAFGTPVFSPTPKATWTITANTCTGTLAPGATCTVSGTAKSWVPSGYEDYLTLPVNTARGYVRIFARSAFAASRYVPVNPSRIVDTRTGLGVSSVLKTGVARTFTVVNRAPADPLRNIPPEAVAITGNLTILKPTSAGYASLTTTASNAPATKTLYAPAGDKRSNAVILRLSDAGTMGLTWQGTAGSSAHATLDVTGYFVPIEQGIGVREGNYRPYGPLRVVDTKAHKGISTHLVAGKPRTFTVPLEGVWWDNTAITGVVTVVKPAQAGSLYIGPAPVVSPTTSALIFKTGDSRANTFFAKLSEPPYGTPKTLSITYTGAAGTAVDVLIDVHGILGESQGFGYVPLVPNRVVDSTVGKGLTKALKSMVRKGVVVENRLPADPSRNLPPDSSQGVLLFKYGITGNLWMIRPSAAGVLTANPPGVPTPPADSTIRSPAGDRRACTVALGWAGQGAGLDLWYAAASGATTNVWFDVTGYFVY